MFGLKTINSVRGNLVRSMIPVRPLSSLSYPPSLQDRYKVSPVRQVPKAIHKPTYVGHVRQNLPSLEGVVHILTPEQIQALKQASSLAAQTVSMLMANVKVGMSLDEIDRIAHDFIISDGAYPSALDFMQYPKSICTSVNDVVAHGMPNSYVLQGGDYLNIDVVCYKNGGHGDTSVMVLLDHQDGSEFNPQISKLSRVTREAMFVGIS